MKPKLEKRPDRWRTPPARGIVGKIEREGGRDGGGLIRGVSVVTRGEALGHGVWIDHVMLDQVAEAVNAEKLGTKSRFTHPGLSGDGLGRFLGRISDARVDKKADLVRGDLHISPTAHETPDGDLAAYVMDLAESDPSAFGTSIVFQHDEKAEDDFAEEFPRSPDDKNTQNYPHVRLARLFADDVVDEPAANPQGLFHRGPDVIGEVNSMLDYCLGQSEQEPELALFDVDPYRIRGYLEKYLDERGLQLVSIDEVAELVQKDLTERRELIDELTRGV